MQNKLNQTLAAELVKAEQELKAIAPLSETHPELTEKDAYAIQNINAQRRMDAGEKLVGYKIGLTAKVVQQRFGVDKPDYGHLFEKMQLKNDSEIDLSTMLQPKIEGEVAFVMAKDLPKSGVTIQNVFDAVDFVTCSFEIVDSRIKDWKIKWVDTIADNGSSARFILSSQKTLLKDVDLAFVGLALSCNGEVEVTGCGAAVMGNPLNAVAFLANELGKYDKQVKAGDIILSGSLSGMLEAKSRIKYECEMWKLGKVSASFKESVK